MQDYRFIQAALLAAQQEPDNSPTAPIHSFSQIITPDIRIKPRYTDAFWGEHPFDGDMILIKNKNKNKNDYSIIRSYYTSYY